MKRKLLISTIATLTVLIAFGLYIGFKVRHELNVARTIIATSMSELSSTDVVSARTRLVSARRTLGSVPATVLRLIPIARQNIQAVDAVVDAGIPVLEDALVLVDARNALGQEALIEDGRVRLHALTDFNEPLSQQLQSLTVLERELEGHRSGWLLPPLWDAVDDFQRRTETLRRSVESASEILDAAPALLGGNGRRTYLVVLLNNAESRGAGGILSAAGTISAINGRLALGPFSYYGEIAEKPPQPVPAPEDFERRFSRYRANTTTIVNATASPDVPEVADVAARLFERVRGARVDGVMVIDPRGISSLMPSEAVVSVPGHDSTLTKENLAEFIYSDSYNLLGGGDPGRRSAILTAGRAAFRIILAGGGGSELLESAGAAVAGGHIRFVSFDDAEDAVLRRLGLTGTLTTDSVDSLLVTVQNLGADKLDYWMRRRIEHTCKIEDEDSASCESAVVLTNATPQGLNDYVTQIDNKIKRSHPYGTYLGYLEIYVPEAAQLTGVMMNGQVQSFYPESENDRKSLGMYFDTPRGSQTAVQISYELRLPESGYSLEITPQPLPSDARVAVEIDAPRRWTFSGHGTAQPSRTSFTGTLDRPLHFDARPDESTGITAAWKRLVEFWSQPLSF